MREPRSDDPSSSSGSGRVSLFERFFGAPKAPPGDEAPATLGRYRILGLLGEGGMGRVYEAEDSDLRRKVALKTLKRLDRSSRKRFLREARAAARVSHPNLCPIFEVGEENKRPYLAMELLKGETLAGRLGRGPLPLTEAIDLAEDLLGALTALHEARVVHRDVKPSNIFLTPYRCRLVDFGLAREMPAEVARAVHSPIEISLPGVIVGTPGYMAPEQILGKDADARADLFAAGAVLYEALSGRRPFPGAAAAALSATLYDEPPPLGDSRELRALDEPIRQALAKKPAERFASAHAVAEALRAATRRGAVGFRSRREVFVGRQAELSWLEDRFSEALAGSGSVAFVSGERGVGKSTLIGEFLRRVRTGPLPVSVVAGRCMETKGPKEAFLPFLDAAGRLLTSRAHDQASELFRMHSPTACVQMPAGLLPDPDGAIRRQTAGASKERLIRESGDFFEAACRAFPILLFLEDLQWADPASVDLLHHLGCRLARQRTLIVAAFRHADTDADNPPLKRCALDLLGRGAAAELTLTAFTREDVASYLEARFPGHRLPAGAASALFERSEGLPLFVRSLVDLLVERNDIVRGEDGWRLARPLSELDLAPAKGLHDLVRAHLEGLSPLERQILEVASVAGPAFLSPVIAHLLDRKTRDVEEDLRRLVRVRRIITEAREDVLPDGTPATHYRFTHTLYAEALREDLVASRRLEIHRGIANRLRQLYGTEAPRLATVIARHCEEGRDFAGAIAFRGHAGDNAARLFAYAEAEEHYDWAFRWVEKLKSHERREAALGLHRRRGAVRLAAAKFDEGAADFEAALRLAREGRDPDMERAALAGLCDTLFFQQRLEALSERADELLQVATRSGAESAVALAEARRGQARVGDGRLDEAIPPLERAIAGARASGAEAPHIAVAYRAFVHYWKVEYAAAEALGAQAAGLARDHGDGFYALGASMFTGMARANLGRTSEAIEDFTDATAVARRNDDRYWLPRLLGNLGWVHRELGAFEQARTYDTEALAAAEPASGQITEIRLNLVLDDVREGRLEDAASGLLALEARVRESTFLKWISELRVTSVAAEYWALRGEHERARERAARLAALARGLGARNYFCAAARVRGLTALAEGRDLASAEADLASALGALEKTPAPLETWRSARVLGHLRRRLGDGDGAHAAFEEAASASAVIALGTRDEALRAGFLALPLVREVMDEAPGYAPATEGRA